MPTLFSRRPGAAAAASSNSKGGGGGGMGSRNEWAGISNTDFPRLDSPSSDDARPLPAAAIADAVVVVPERSLSAGAAQHRTHTTAGRARSHGNGAAATTHFLAPQRSIDSGVAHHYQGSALSSVGHGSANGLLAPPSLHHAALGMSHGGSASSATRLHALLAAEHAEPPHAIAYGYTPIPDGIADVQLELHGVEKIVDLCGYEIKARGIDVPLIFSSMALDLSASNVKSLIANLLQPDFHQSQATSTTAAHIVFGQAFINEVRFANPHDLAALIKWALARLGRVFEVPLPVQAKGKVQEEVIFMQQRGFLDLDVYMAWRDEERRSHYALTAFDFFLKAIPSQASALLMTLFSLLSSVTAYSLKNGMTPSKISRLFGVLLFGLPEDETFARTYDAFARASNATEHLFLAYIRYLSATSSLPTRLTESVMGYPSMLVPELTAPGKQARGVPLTQIERTVRLYSVDLIQSAAELDVGAANDCPEWAACRALPGEDSVVGGPEPQLSEKYRKLINLRGQAIRKKVGGAGVGTGGANGEGGLGGVGGSQSRDAITGKLVGSALDAVAVESYGSLASKKWGDFMSEGFASTDPSKLTFDLRESQRKVRTQAPENRHWSDFAQAGFTVNDNGLDNVLHFDDGLKEEMERWPGERAELNERLRQTQKRLPHFPYDTTPRVVASPSISEMEGDSPPGQGQQHMHPISRMDETFAEVWADYLVGCGWSNRDELTHRNANFVVVQYRSRPIVSAVGVQAAQRSRVLHPGRPSSGVEGGQLGGAGWKDDRTDAAWFVIEEVVPASYRAELEAVGRRKGSSKPMIRKLNLFRKLAGSKRDKQLPPVNGHGYGGGSGNDHDDVFRPGPGGPTRVLKLNDPAYGAPDSSFSSSSFGGGASSTRRTSEDSAGANDVSVGSRIVSTLRNARSRRGRDTGRDSNATPPPPPPPPKDSPHYERERESLTTPTPADASFTRSRLSPYTAGQRQRADSLNSADIETRSFRDPEAELSFSSSSSAKGAGGLPLVLGLPWKRGAGLRHQHKRSKDDAWVDILMKDPSSSSSAQGHGHGHGTGLDDNYNNNINDDGLPRSRSGSGFDARLGPAAPAGAAGAAAEDEWGRQTPVGKRVGRGGSGSPDDYDRGAKTPTPTPGGPGFSSSPSAGAAAMLTSMPPSSSTPVAMSKRVPPPSLAGLGGVGAAGGAGASPPGKSALAASGWTLSLTPTHSTSASVIAGAGGAEAGWDGPTAGACAYPAEGALRTPRAERDHAAFGRAGDGSIAAPTFGQNGHGNANANVNGSSSLAVGDDGSERGAPLAPPSPIRKDGFVPTSGASTGPGPIPMGGEADLNTRIAAEAAAAAAQIRTGTGTAAWEVEAQRKAAEQLRIQESLRLARSLRDKLRTVEARERGGSGSGGAGVGGTGAGADAASGEGGLPTPSATLTSLASPTSSTSTTTSPTSNKTATAAPAPAPLLRPAIDPFAKNRTAGRVADIASRFGGPSRRTASGGSESASTSGAGPAGAPRSPLAPLSPQATGSEYEDAASSSHFSASVAPAGPGPTVARPGDDGGLDGVGASEREVLLDDEDATPNFNSNPNADRLSMAPPESEGGRSSLDAGAYHTDGDSIYPDDAASNYSRETSGTTEEEGLGRFGSASLSAGGAGGWTYAWKRGPAALGGGAASHGAGLGGLGGLGGGNGLAFPGDAGRGEEEDDGSMPMPPIFREPYQPGMPLDNVTEESESVISGSNV